MEQSHGTTQTGLQRRIRQVAQEAARPSTLDMWAACMVQCARLFVLSVLTVSAIVVFVLIFLVLSEDQDSEYRISFQQDALDIMRAATEKARTTVEMTNSVASLYSSFASESGPSVSLPFLTLRDLEAFCSPVRQAAQTELFFYTPYLANEAYRAEWERHAQEQKDWLVRSHSFLQQTTTATSTTLLADGSTEWNFSPIPPQVWALKSELGATNETVFASSNATAQVVTDLAPPHTPLWQMSPPPVDTGRLNYDLYTYPQFARLVDHVRTTAQDTLSPPTDLINQWVRNTRALPSASTAVPRSLLVHPVFSSLETDKAYFAAAVSTIVSWESLFSNLLSDGTNGVMVVVDSCGSNMTLVLNGPEVEFKGYGNHHKGEFEALVESRPLRYRLAANGPDLCPHTMYVFPTQDYKDAYVDGKPVYYAFMTMTLFGFSAVVFLTYDLLTSQRQKRTQRKATRTADLVASLFPSGIGERLFRRSKKFQPGFDADMSFNHDDISMGYNSINVDNALALDRPEDPLQSSFVERANNQGFADRPIAELFPEATVSFADIAGFTAWSSIREPSHVFTLLETIFRSFDECAQKYGVFKVETVGDCYVAVVGVPEYCKDHALVMARFARECLEKFDGVLSGLEPILGSDTCDLAMRFGLHSGPVTAGVLRGDRARFQLFGDTVNTAGRIEHSGVRKRIHVSEQTAALLIAAGKTEWISARQDAIEAGSGKGTMKTFFCQTVAEQGDQRMRESTLATSAADHSEVSAGGTMRRMRSIRRLGGDAAGESKRIQRLIDWNTELLAQLLRQVLTRRAVLALRASSRAELDHEASKYGEQDHMAVDEVAEVIAMPEFKPEVVQATADVKLDSCVLEQLSRYVTSISSMYHEENPFHNFEHASHVTMSVSKLLSRIVAPQKAQLENNQQMHEFMHDHTYGITSDPLTQFAVVLSALIHDIDHQGVPNFMLAHENPALAQQYHNRSIAEQNSLDMAWDTLLTPEYADLRDCIFGSVDELRRFRQLLVNSVIATDIFDKDLGSARLTRWNKAFSKKGDSNTNRKATIVIEHLIQASDVAHTMQHWHVYQKWNEKLFAEMYAAFLEGRSPRDPSENWFQGELGFFDNYVIPLAKKLKDCGVFGVASDEYLNYATENRREWAAKGEEVVKKLIEKYGGEESGSEYSFQ